MDNIIASKETKVGALIVLIFTVMLLIVDAKIILYIFFLSFVGWLSIVLYEFKTATPRGFYLIKVPLNIFFNYFLYLLLLKSWAMREYKEDFKKLDDCITEKEELKHNH